MDRPHSSLFGAVLPRVAIAAFGLVLTGALGGCVETAALSGAETPAPRPDWPRTPLASALRWLVSAAFRSRWKIV